jgi:replicative DNA helicase
MSAAAESVIGGILLAGRDAYWRVADVLAPEDFPTPFLANAFRACGEVAKSAADVDTVTVADEMDRIGHGSDAFQLIGLVSATPGAANIRAYAETVKSDAIARRVRVICATGAKTGDVATVQAELGALLNAQPAHAQSAADVLKRMWQGVMDRYAAGDEISGIPTGFPLIDEWTGGLQPGRVYGIGARAKMGKTVLAMNICANVALSGRPVAVWSLEMSDEELMQRMACAVSGVASQVMQRPRLLDTVDGAMSGLQVATERLRDAPLWVSDRTDVTVEQIEAQARQMHAMGRLDLLCIDYLGLLRLPKADRHDLAVAHATRRIKIIAKELRIPILLVFQLNRGSENGQAVRAPRPSDARDSGAIEQDLDAMFLLHRPSYYDKNAPKGLRLDLALQRNGQTGLIRMNDELHACRFTGGTDEWVESQVATGGRDDDL